MRSLVLSLFLFSKIASAATVAIIDSGVDIDHVELRSKAWQNPVDYSFDLTDNDGNGKVDDVYGWNFIENNNVLIDLTQVVLLTQDVKTFFTLQAKVVKGEASEAEKAWLRRKVSDTEFRGRLTQYATFAHGTHVAGVAAFANEANKIFTVRLIPTKNPLQAVSQDVSKAVAEGKDPNWIVKNIIKAGLYVFAKLQGRVFGPIGTYLAGEQVDVANGSFGLGMPQARNLVYPILKLVSGKKEPRPELVDEFAIFFTKQVVKSHSALAKNAPNTLFVFAAGNDGLNNDEYPVSPASVKLDNTITVAATTASGELASFSNYGGETVEIAALGVAVDSTTPRGPNILMSGTSQAAPQVAGAAAGIKSLNTKLTPTEIKRILIETVDENPTLRGKVSSGGVLNTERALYAANLSREMSIPDALMSARVTILSQRNPANYMLDTELLLVSPMQSLLVD